MPIDPSTQTIDIRRIITGLALAVVLLFVLWHRGWPLLFIILLVCALGLWEFYSLFWGKDRVTSRICAIVLGWGMGVSTFSLGFGPKILKYRKGKTEYALSLVPLGGYVALVGESDPKDIPEGFTQQESFALRPAWQRLLVVAAGPVANILLAWLLCWALAFGWGTPVLLPQVGAVVQNGPADKAGMPPVCRRLLASCRCPKAGACTSCKPWAHCTSGGQCLLA